METLILSGNETSKKIRAEIAGRIKETGLIPTLAVVLVGSDPASAVYVRNKEKACEKTGIRAINHHLPDDTDAETLRKLLINLDSDPEVDGILLQLPLPAHLDEKDFLPLIRAEKDVDGFHPVNQGKLLTGEDALFSCTPNGVIQILKHFGVEISGKHAVVLGRSNIVGKPMMSLLLRENATVTVCHSKTADLEKHVAMADILVVALGRRGIVKSSWIRPETVVVDVGIHRLDDGSVAGDLEQSELMGRVKALTPVPGGVGPMTITMLLHNTLKAAEKNRQ